MSRIRSIKPEFWTSEQVMCCSPITRLLFIGLWNFADDYGIHPASCMRLKAEVFPVDNFSMNDIQCCIDELIKHRLIQVYDVHNASYWIITGWQKHQKIDKPTHRHPLPLFDESSPSTPRLLAEDSPSSPRVVDEPSGTEGKGDEGKGRDISLVVSEANDSPPNATSLSNYPQEEIIALYHEILPACRQVCRWTKARNQHLRQRWREDPKHQRLAFWKKYFEHVAQSDFLTGRIVRRDNRPPFLADLEWLIQPSNFTNVIEGKYHGETG